MKSILFLDSTTGQPSVLLVQGFVYEGRFYGTAISTYGRTPVSATLPYQAYLDLLAAGDLAHLTEAAI